jgi:hypothetical protein
MTAMTTKNQKVSLYSLKKGRSNRTLVRIPITRADVGDDPDPTSDEEEYV